jgi:PKD domain
MKHVGSTKLGWFAILVTLSLTSGCLEETGPENLASETVGDPVPLDVSFSVSTTSGVMPLEVQFTAPQHSEINEYHWNFDDGTTMTGRTQTHTFTDAGTYTVTLTATVTDGTQYTAQQNISAFASINNADAIVPGTALFYDSFEYDAGREDSGVTSIFQNNGWSAVKTQQVSPERNPRGYIYTTDTVPGYEGGMLPGANSQRVVAMEALPTTLGNYIGPDTFWGDMQTDFYLQFGGADQPPGTIPADVWFQFWLYTTGGMTGGFTRTQNKFLYPCDGSYPCQNESWVQYLGTTSASPHWVELSADSEPLPDVFLRLRGPDAVWTPGNSQDLGHTDTSELILGQRWVLVRLHMDTSGPQGIYEAWMKPMGGREVKVAEHIGGVTPGFDWPISDRSGHRVLRMPTTIGNRYVVDNYPESYDVTFYMDDFTMATSEDDLPRYPY